MLTKHLRIHGEVQGVWYRESMRIEAVKLGATGWVRNRLDGSVEAIVQGAPGVVATMIEWAKHGPERAEVSRVEVSDADIAISGAERFDSFLKFPTA